MENKLAGLKLEECGPQFFLQILWLPMTADTEQQYVSSFVRRPLTTTTTTPCHRYFINVAKNKQKQSALTSRLWDSINERVPVNLGSTLLPADYNQNHSSHQNIFSVLTSRTSCGMFAVTSGKHARFKAGETGTHIFHIMFLSMSFRYVHWNWSIKH